MKRIALQLAHKDSHFYEVSANSGYVSGMFQGEELIPFYVTYSGFLHSAFNLGHIADYDDRPTGTVFIPDDYEGVSMPSYEWVEYTVTNDEETTQDVLRHVYEEELEIELQKITEALRVRSIDSTRISATMDEGFCKAVLDLADIIRQNNKQWAQE